MIVPLNAPRFMLAFLCSVLPHDLDKYWLARYLYFVVVIGSTYMYVKGSIDFYGVLWTRTTIKKPVPLQAVTVMYGTASVTTNCQPGPHRLAQNPLTLPFHYQSSQFTRGQHRNERIRQEETR